MLVAEIWCECPQLVRLALRPAWGRWGPIVEVHVLRVESELRTFLVCKFLGSKTFPMVYLL